MTVKDRLIETALTEWTRWGGPVERIDGSLVGFGSAQMEADHPHWIYVGEYWKSIGSTLDGRDDVAWSAAFISHCFQHAGAGKLFPYHENHSYYAAAIASGEYSGLSIEDPAGLAPIPGDLIWASRTGKGCRTPPATYADSIAELKKIHQGKASGFCSHTDIVVATRGGEVDVIGGNVKQAVTRTTYRLDIHGRMADGRRNFIGVIRNAL
ncbi:MAG: DUF2272 domain-containing protein [Sphingopyxis sp.]|nr:DUF2272 domain-containing protein [Sphingopyxis sp.]